MDDKRSLLIVLTRFPTPGKAKTRLIPRLGEYGAARLHREMALHTVKTACSLRPDIAVEIHYDGGSEADNLELFGPVGELHPQSAGDLGHRMFNAFRSAFDRGFRRIVLIGTDCPSMTRETIDQAFGLLDFSDCVFGPSHDGGYYLIGLKNLHREIFAGISWGGSSVLEETLAQAHGKRLAISLLERLPDIDRPEDIPHWQAVYGRTDHTISLIVPVLNEEKTIAESCRHLGQKKNMELIIVDGGSSDRTVEIAVSYNARVVHSRPGRSLQMNLGADVAQGEILFFLHADTSLPGDFERLIVQTLADPGTIAGAFSLGFQPETPALKVIGWGARLRSRLLQLPYGDQGLFLRREDFRIMGGFPELPIMEDAAFVTALRRKGRIEILSQKAVTSARRYARLGVLQTWIINQCVIACFLMGRDPSEIARLYRGHCGIREWLRLMKGSAEKQPDPYLEGRNP